MNSKSIHVSLAGGLGNQLFQIAAALSLTDGKIIVHDFLGNARRDSTNVLEVQNFNLPSRIEFAPKIPISKFGVRLLNSMYKTSVKPQALLSRLSNLKTLNALKNYYFSQLIGAPIKVVQAQNAGFFDLKILNETSLLVGYFQSAYWASKLNSTSELRQIKLRETNMKQFLRDKSLNKVLALHIRLGDYSKEPKIGMLTDSYFAKALETVENVKLIHEIWMFSDEPEKAKEYIPEKWHPILKVIPSMSAAKTLELMRQADYYVISNSTFSWWGAFLSNSADCYVVAPSPWFKLMESPRDIIPISWTSLQSSFKN